MASTPEHAARVLGLTVDASLEDVRRARRNLALKYHPDRCRNTEMASRHMARINAAVDTLVAHLRDRAKRDAARQYWGDRASELCKAIWTASAKPETAHTTATTSRSAPPKAERASPRPVRQHTQRVSRPPVAPQAQGEADLIRFAAASYRSVLDRISKMDVAPTVDVRVMGYSGQG